MTPTEQEDERIAREAYTLWRSSHRIPGVAPAHWDVLGTPWQEAFRFVVAHARRFEIEQGRPTGIEIWCEGYRANGDSSGAVRIGFVESARTLKEACDAWATEHPVWAKDYSPDGMTYWGCRLFDNEADARKAFG